MHRLIDKITPMSVKSYTYLKEYRNIDFEQNLVSSLLDRLKLLEIPNQITLDGISRVILPSNTDSIDNFSHNIQLKVEWSLTNQETGEITKEYFILNIPELYNGLKLLINGREYFLLLSFASRSHINSNDKIIFKLNDEMQILYLDGIPSWNINGKRVNMFSVMALAYLYEGKTLSALLENVIPNYEITGKTDARLKVTNNITFKDFAVLLPKYPNKATKPWVKALERLKTYTAADFQDIELLSRKIRGSYGSPTSRKSTVLLNELVQLIRFIKTDVIEMNILMNIKNEYTFTSLETEAVYVETMIAGVHSTIKKNFKTYLSSHQQSQHKMERIFNKTLFLNLCANSLFLSKLLQFRDSTSNLSPDLKVSLSHQSGSRTSDSAREITEDYEYFLALNYVAAGESAGLSSVIAPI